MSTVSVLVGGYEYTGWTSVNIQRSLEQASGSFTLSINQREARWLARYPIQLGAECQVQIDGVTVINGVLEKLSPQLSGDSRSLSVSGRDATRDLIDCSAEIPKQELKNATVADVAKLLLAPLGISLDCPDPGKPFAKIAINDGESAFAVIEQHARQRGLLCYTLGDKVLHVRKANPQVLPVRIEEDMNLLSGSAEHDHSELFGSYEVKSQATGGKHAVKSTATGTGASQRKLIITAEKSETDTQVRADWEAKTRQAKSKQATVSVRGWQYEKGQLWSPNSMVWLESPSLMFAQAVLIKGVTYTLDDNGGEITSLELVDPDTYAEEPA